MRNDRGAAAVVVAVLAALGLLALSGAVAMVELVSTRVRMSAAADLAALAAARDGDCEAGLQIAFANHAQEADCAEDGEDVVVFTQRSIRLFGRPLAVRAHARAGPP